MNPMNMEGRQAYNPLLSGEDGSFATDLKKIEMLFFFTLSYNNQPCLPSFPTQRPSTASRPTRASRRVARPSTTSRGSMRRTLHCRHSHGERTCSTKRHFNQIGILRGGNFIKSINVSGCTHSVQDGK